MVNDHTASEAPTGGDDGIVDILEATGDGAPAVDALAPQEAVADAERGEAPPDGADALVWDAGDGSDIAAKGEHIEIESWSPSPAPAQDDAFYVDESGVIEATLEPTADAGQVVLENSMVTSYSLSSGGDEPLQGPAGDAGGIGINEKWMRGDSGTSNASDGPGAGPGDVAARSDAAGYDFPGDYAQPFDGIAEAGAESGGKPDVIADAGGGSQPMTVGGSEAPTVGGTQTESVGVARGMAGEPPGDLATGEPEVGPAEVPEGSISLNFEKITQTYATDHGSDTSQEPVADLLDEDESPLLVTLEEGTRPMSTMATGDVDVESPDAVDLDDDAEPEL
jgi:hypothetical protein